MSVILLGPISKVQALNLYDTLAEVPLLGTVTSVVRITHNILAVVYDTLKYILCSKEADKTRSLENRKIHVIELKIGIIEMIPIFGNFYAVRMNKAQNELSNNSTTDQLKTVKSFLAQRVLHERSKFFEKINQMSQEDLQTSLKTKCDGVWQLTAWQEEIATAIQKRIALMMNRAGNISEINFLSKEQLGEKINNVKTRCKPELKEFWREYLEKMEQRLADLNSGKATVQNHGDDYL